MKRVLFLISILFFLTGCVGHMSYNAGQVHCSWFKFSDAPPSCTVYDPILKQQVLISEGSNGIITTCSTYQPCTVELWYHTTCRTCQATYTDSMGNTFKGKSFLITAGYCKDYSNYNDVVCQ